MNQFYLVVVQYAAKLSSQKISAAVLRLKPGGERLSRARCNLQVAPEEVGGEGGRKGPRLARVVGVGVGVVFVAATAAAVAAVLSA